MMSLIFGLFAQVSGSVYLIILLCIFAFFLFCFDAECEISTTFMIDFFSSASFKETEDMCQ